MKIVWTNEKIQEWRQHLGYFIPQLVKKTLDNYTQDYLGVRQKEEVIHKNMAVVIFSSLSDPMSGIFRNKKTCFRGPVGEYPRRENVLGPRILWCKV